MSAVLLRTDVEESNQLVSRFVAQFPRHRELITMAIHTWAVEQHRALFFIPISSLQRTSVAANNGVLVNERDYVEVHVYDLSTGKLVDIGTTFAWGDLETSLLRMVDNYKQDACDHCIQERTLCLEHRPPGGQKYIETTCESCGHYDEHSDEGSQETFTYLHPCDTKDCMEYPCNGVYECGDCGHEIHAV